MMISSEWNKKKKNNRSYPYYQTLTAFSNLVGSSIALLLNSFSFWAFGKYDFDFLFYYELLAVRASG